MQYIISTSMPMHCKSAIIESKARYAFSSMVVEVDEQHLARSRNLVLNLYLLNSITWLNSDKPPLVGT